MPLPARIALLLLAVGCSRPPDPDALFRKHDMDGAAAAWQEREGHAINLDGRIADILATRAASDPSITVAYTLDAMDAAHLLSGAPTMGIQKLDIGIGTLESFLATAEAYAAPPLTVVVGRSATAVDKDPYQGGPLPWRGGAMVGWAHANVAALGQSVDKAAPPCLVTVVLRDRTGAVWVTMFHDTEGWWATAASNAWVGGRIVDAQRVFLADGAAAVKAKFPGGLVPADP